MNFLQEVPKVGNNYQVPCVKLDNEFIPIINPVAVDEHFLNPMQLSHVHEDLRFRTDNELNSFYESDRNLLSLAPVPLTILHKDNDLIEHREFKCTRTQDAFYINETNMELQKSHAFKRMKCNKCPHQGTDLSSFSPDEDGNVRCPAHGLTWNKKSGYLVQTKSPQEKMVHNYLKHHLMPSKLKISTYTNNLTHYITPEMKLLNFKIEFTLETEVEIELRPFSFKSKEVQFKTNQLCSFANGLVYWTEGFEYPIFVAPFTTYLAYDTFKILANYDCGKNRRC